MIVALVFSGVVAIVSGVVVLYIRDDQRTTPRSRALTLIAVASMLATNALAIISLLTD